MRVVSALRASVSWIYRASRLNSLGPCGPLTLCPPYLSRFSLEFSRPLRASVRSFISIHQVVPNLSCFALEFEFSRPLQASVRNWHSPGGAKYSVRRIYRASCSNSVGCYGPLSTSRSNSLGPCRPLSASRSNSIGPCGPL